MENSKIEWTDHTFNPWIGCTKVSPGCAHCYAETLMDARYGRVKWGKGNPRSRTSAANWKEPIRWSRNAEADCLRWAEKGDAKKRRPRVFCASLSDWLDDEVPLDWLADLLDLIRKCQHLDWLLLTKRPENFRPRLLAAMESCVGRMDLENWIFAWIGQKADGALINVDPEPPANVWIGTSVEDRQRADERIPSLLAIPAVVRFLSCEPLLGPLEFSNVTKRSDAVAQLGKKALTGIHWVICGGESGPNARPMHPTWAISLRNQCSAAGVPFLYKQWGEWAPVKVLDDNRVEFTHDLSTKCPINPEWYLFQNMDKTQTYMARVGKAAAGRLLDGVEHNGYPTA
jgi:protein gp37